MRVLFGHEVDLSVEAPTSRLYVISASRRNPFEGFDNVWAETWEAAYLTDPHYIADHMSSLIQKLLGAGFCKRV
jgi:hypothetical protein